MRAPRPTTHPIRSLAKEGTRRLRCHEVPDPQRQHEREAIAAGARRYPGQPLAVATCDLDWTMIFDRALFVLPIALGHECVAEVVEGPERFVPGERVVVQS